MNVAAPIARPYIRWRLLALSYDFFPMLGVWFSVGAAALALNHNQPVRVGSVAGWLELIALWAVTGAYAVISWHRGGQTLGMRPWRLRVTDARGGTALIAALIRRYVVGSVSLLLAGFGFWWAWIDRDGLTWHDRVSGTRMVREMKRASPHV